MVEGLIYIRLIAILLIVNSHLAQLYPHASLSFGGYLGNSLFYFISGLGLALSMRRSPTSTWPWALKRLIKTLLPIVMIAAIIELGDWHRFTHKLYDEIIWHDTEQLESFLPVLWVLYVLFYPINKLSRRQSLYFVGFVLAMSSLLFAAIGISGQQIPRDLPSHGVFFLLTAIICFTLGIATVRYDLVSPSIRRPRTAVIASLAVVFSAQALHQLFSHLGGLLIPLNFYLNIISVVGIYALLSVVKLSFLARFLPSLSRVASSSLAVYLVHFKMIGLVSAENLSFPTNIAAVYLYSFLAAYPLMLVANATSTFLLRRWVGTSPISTSE